MKYLVEVILIILCLIFLNGCKPSSSSKEISSQIVISKRDSQYIADDVSKPPSPIYSGLNLIIDSLGFIYFHSSKIESTLPENKIIEHVDSLETKLTLIGSNNDVKSIDRLVDSILNIMLIEKWKLVEIASTTDTVNMRSIELIQNSFLKGEKFILELRMATHQEIKYLTQNYNAKNRKNKN